jgi:hypothetical protein
MLEMGGDETAGPPTRTYLDVKAILVDLFYCCVDLLQICLGQGVHKFVQVCKVGSVPCVRSIYQRVWC